MSQIIVEDEAYRRIMADERLQRARTKLSFHELRLIIQHVRAADSGKGGDSLPINARHMLWVVKQCIERGDHRSPSPPAPDRANHIGVEE